MWYSKVTNNLAEIPNFITYYENELQVAKSECKVGGIIEKNIMFYEKQIFTLEKLYQELLNIDSINCKKLKPY